MPELRIDQGERLADVLRARAPQVIAAVIGSELIALLRRRVGHAAERQAADTRGNPGGALAQAPSTRQASSDARRAPGTLSAR